jgi:hypothetical protein
MSFVLKTIVKAIQNGGGPKAFLSIAGIFRLRAMIIEVFTAMVVKIFDNKASPVQRNLMFLGLLFIFFFK